MAHLDVVPVEGEWTHAVRGGRRRAVWGRGTLDDKGSLVAICEAVETLLGPGYTPAQDVWLSFGCNEEVFGTRPAAVEELRRRGVRPWFVLDEGGAVAYEALPGVGKPIAVIGVTEKGDHLARARASTVAAATPRRRPGWARPPGWPGRSPGSTGRRCRPPARRDHGAVPAAAPHAPLRAAAAVATPTGSARCSPGLLARWARDRRDGAHHGRGDHAVGSPPSTSSPAPPPPGSTCG